MTSANDTENGKRWVRRPEGSNWGDFGADDQVGRLNLITPERRLRAIGEVAHGLAFCLSLPLDLPGGSALNPRRRPPQRHLLEREPGWYTANYPVSRLNPVHKDCVCDDHVTLFTQYSTQWDALSHVGQQFDADGDGVEEIVYYNGFRAGEHILGPQDPGGPGASALGIENAAATAIQGRGVMIDLHARFGNERRRVGYADLKAIIDDDHLEIGEGDLVCLHTGFGQALMDMGGDPDPQVLHGQFAVLAGDDPALQDWIRETGLAALIADNYAVEDFGETSPGGKHVVLPLHELCLFKLGIHLGELWYLTPLADWLRAHGRTSFLLTAPPLRLPGSFGSPLTPVATV